MNSDLKDALLVDLKIQWEDHMHMRDQCWKTIQICAALVIGLVGADLRFQSILITAFIGFLVILASLSGIRITERHRKKQAEKFDAIFRIEEALGLIPEIYEYEPEPKEASELKDLQCPRPKIGPSQEDYGILDGKCTPTFIMHIHWVIVAFAAVFILARAAGALASECVLSSG